MPQGYAALGEAHPAGTKVDSKVDAAMPWEFWILRASLALAIGALCYALAPFALHGVGAAGAGFLIALVILLAELRLRHAALSGLVGGACGAIAGIFAALLLTLIISRTSQPPAAKSFLEIISLLGLAYLGLVAGIHCGAQWAAEPRPGAAARDSTPNPLMKLLDTSVLIDGRIAEICEAHFLDGLLAVPQFVLHELQLVADSSDPLKRQRGRRGLEVLQRIQKMPQVDVRVIEDDFSRTADVDHKLIELARRTGARIVTNDFNLNKVATVQGFCVLNVNELANALKPVVLPGEAMHVLIQREGKEAMQGVAYLNDGTMVVVDGARRMINKTVDIVVTSVHQTTAGKMIFGRVDERAEPAGPLARAAAAGRATGGNLAPSYGSSAGSTREDEKDRALESRGGEEPAPFPDGETQ
ncbi:MAG TPA: PIN domain-containing protein [Candidatus Acidoferrum sp.]